MMRWCGIICQMSCIFKARSAGCDIVLACRKHRAVTLCSTAGWSSGNKSCFLSSFRVVSRRNETVSLSFTQFHSVSHGFTITSGLVSLHQHCGALFGWEYVCRWGANHCIEATQSFQSSQLQKHGNHPGPPPRTSLYESKGCRCGHGPRDNPYPSWAIAHFKGYVLADVDVPRQYAIHGECRQLLQSIFCAKLRIQV